MLKTKYCFLFLFLVFCFLSQKSTASTGSVPLPSSSPTASRSPVQAPTSTKPGAIDEFGDFSVLDTTVPTQRWDEFGFESTGAIATSAASTPPVSVHNPTKQTTSMSSFDDSNASTPRKSAHSKLADTIITNAKSAEERFDNEMIACLNELLKQFEQGNQLFDQLRHALPASKPACFDRVLQMMTPLAQYSQGLVCECAMA